MFTYKLNVVYTFFFSRVLKVSNSRFVANSFSVQLQFNGFFNRYTFNSFPYSYLVNSQVLIPDMSNMEYHFNLMYQNLNDPQIQISQALSIHYRILETSDKQLIINTEEVPTPVKTPQNSKECLELEIFEFVDNSKFDTQRLK